MTEDNQSYTRQEIAEVKEYIKLLVDATKENLTARIEAVDRFVCMRLAAMAEAVEVASKTLDEKLSRMDSAAYVTRQEFQDRFIRSDEDMKKLQLSEARLAGMADQKSVTFATGMAVIGLVLGIVGIILSLIRG